MGAAKRKHEDAAATTTKSKSKSHKDKKFKVSATKSSSSSSYSSSSSTKKGKMDAPLKPKNLVEDSGDEDASEFGEDDGEYDGGVSLSNGAPDAHPQSDHKADQKGGQLNSSKSRESHAVQKKLVQERKQSKPNADVLHRSKKIWERLRRKSHVPAEERKKLTDELFRLITGRVQELVFKHDASRVVQTAIKYGNAERKQDIARELKGSFAELAQSSYGKYLVVKLMHYGTAETKSMIIGEFFGHVRKLIRHKEACFVIDDAYSQFATPKEKAALLREFYGVEYALFKDGSADGSLKDLLEKQPEKRQVIMKSLFELISQVVAKEATFFNILHRAMLEYLVNANPESSEISEFIELVKEHVGMIASTKDGSQVVMRCFAWGTAKDRKQLVKNLKDRFADMYGNEFGYMVLLTIFDVVDDTVMVSKAVFPEIESGILDAALHKFARIPLLYPLAGREPRLVPPGKLSLLNEMDEIRAKTSKKSPEVRQEELRKGLSPMLLKALAENAETLAKDSFGSHYIQEVLLSADGDKTGAAEAVATLAEGDPSGPDHIASSAGGCRMLKSLVQSGFYNTKTKTVAVSDPTLNFHTVLVPKMEAHLVSWATGGGSFVVVSLLETGLMSSKEKSALRKQLSDKKVKPMIKKAADEGNKGSALILELLKK